MRLILRRFLALSHFYNMKRESKVLIVNVACITKLLNM